MKGGRCALLFACCAPIWSSCQWHDTPGTTGDRILATTAEAPVSLVRLLDSLGANARYISFLVDKSDRTFTVRVKAEAVKVYPCVLGENPVGDKFHQGDRRTPEGRFTFRSKRVHPQWHKFIWVDYPNAESWKRYRQRLANGAIPTGKDIGGEIGIHGVPAGMDHWVVQGMDWTWGCIALRNSDVDEIYPHIIPNVTEMEVIP